MATTLDLKSLEKKAFRSMHQDGLLDINMGGTVASFAVLEYHQASEAFPLMQFSLFLAGLLASTIIFWVGKKFITVPRLGQVKFGPQRQRRARTLMMVLSGIVLLQVLIFIGTTVLWHNPQWAAKIGFGQATGDLGRLTVAIVGALFVGPSLTLVAFFTDFLRGYYIAFIISLGVFSLIWFDNPIYMIAAGLIVIIPGVILFIRFLRQYPLPPVAVTHD